MYANALTNQCQSMRRQTDRDRGMSTPMLTGKSSSTRPKLVLLALTRPAKTPPNTDKQDRPTSNPNTDWCRYPQRPPKPGPPGKETVDCEQPNTHHHSSHQKRQPPALPMPYHTTHDLPNELI